jgi:gag-polypeptide of LTR copia-type
MAHGNASNVVEHDEEAASAATAAAAARERVKAKLADSIKWNDRHTLHEDNYRPWAISAKAIIRSKRCVVLLLPLDHPDACDDEELQDMGKSLLLQTVDEKYYEYIHKADTVYEVFESLRLLRHGHVDNHRIQLFFKFHGIVLEPGEKIRDLVGRVKKTVHQLGETCAVIEEQHAAVAILIAVNQDIRFGHQVQHMIATGMDLDYNNVQAALITCEDMASMSAPRAFAATPHAGEIPPAAPVADAIAALSKQVQSLSSKLGRQQQQHRKNGPVRKQQQQQQQQQRKTPYTKPQENKPQQGTTHDPA